MIGSLGYDPATMTVTDVLGIAGAAAATVIIVLAILVTVIMLMGPPT